ncbi:E2-like enzyme [Zygosaccharomyces mellis]|uniref:Autophagy-related protein 3 n=1 Tax=Zygosaccharomyces mellis TaxID=42258 RepID=A0A4C2E4P2_9SACH|nr:E2-like enzyme [Zygosaccharomyces mellis]
MIRSTLSSWREYLTPVSHKSTFLTTGNITPDEFRKAGDYLCHMFPTWKWNEPSKDISYRDFLPQDKQFLVSRKVPCSERAQALVSISQNEPEVDEDGWLVEGQSIVKSTKQQSKSENTIEVDDIDEMMKDMEIQGNDDIVDIPVNQGERYYDLYITYSTSYRVPKMYIVGFSNAGVPLTPQEMFEDIAPDYRTKTATIEKLPFYKNSVLSVSIHPCKHANVMKTLLDKVRTVRQRHREEENREKDDQDDWEDVQQDLDDALRVDQYLVVFLKFITGVTPSIEHDYTMEGW